MEQASSNKELRITLSLEIVDSVKKETRENISVETGQVQRPWNTKDSEVPPLPNKDTIVEEIFYLPIDCN